MSHPFIHSNHISIVRVDMIDIFGLVNAEGDHCYANATSE